MINTPEQLNKVTQANAETLATIANTAFASAERIAALNLDAARALLEQSVTNTKALMAAKTPQDLLALQTALVQPSLEKAVAYSKNVQTIAAEAKETLDKIFAGQLAELNRNVITTLDQATKNAPGSDVAIGAVKSAIAAANAAYENLSKVAKQMAEVANANVAAATDVAVKASKGR
jgi:phasin family protein